MRLLQFLSLLSGETSIPPEGRKDFIREVTFRNYARSKVLVWFTFILAVGICVGVVYITKRLPILEFSLAGFVIWLQVFLVFSSSAFLYLSSVEDALTVPELQARHEKLWYSYGIALLFYTNVMFLLNWIQTGFVTAYIIGIFIFAVFFYYPNRSGFLIFSLNALFYFICITFIPSQATMNKPIYLTNAWLSGIVVTGAAWLFNRLLLDSQLRDFRSRKKIEQQAQELRNANEQLQRLAMIDGLTQVSNRRLFDEKLEQEWRRLSRSESPLSIILCDVDYFKKYNDTYGHLAGDACLKEVAKAIQLAVRRPADVVARYGGEEFAVILPETGAAGALHVAEKILQQVSSLKIPHRTSSVADHVTVSVGIATTIPSMDMQPTQLLQKADESLYRAKQGGRNRVVHQSLTLVP
ncbi:MAG: diguanylate cyclase [Pseudanabaenaceae cyanobacterium SKYGB_i_bin29]|nr:diguanylate cyclase [Pseudanabaenaceae cyanobacterium SKYG29]MDW8420477.1 diguanylate cyclase [Pseudanabaenaceae cyanobacterium SKYGB_i_bin29]